MSEAESAGVKVIRLGGEAAKDNPKRQLPLTLLVDPSRDLEVMRDEIFGPILPIVPYDDLESAIDEINAGERPLGLYVFGDDLDAANKIIDQTNSGGAAINCARDTGCASFACVRRVRKQWDGSTPWDRGFSGSSRTREACTREPRQMRT